MRTALSGLWSLSLQPDSFAAIAAKQFLSLSLAEGQDMAAMIKAPCSAILAALSGRQRIWKRTAKHIYILPSDQTRNGKSGTIPQRTS
jgi:hypothetical protein